MMLEIKMVAHSTMRTNDAGNQDGCSFNDAQQ